jgi:hypothetical protein
VLAQAAALRDRGKLEEAAYTLRSAIREKPTFGRAHYELALIYFQLNQDALGKAALFRAAALSPSDPDVIPAIAKYTPRIAKIELSEAYAARDRQEAADAARASTPVAAPAPRTPAPVSARPAPAAPGAPKSLNLPPLAPKAGTISGRVVRPDGTPVPSFTIDYSGFEDGKLATYGAGGIANDTVNSSVKGSGGRYTVKLPPGAYRVSGYVTYPYKGRTYHFPLEQLNAPARHDYDGLGLDKLRGGLVRDFVLKMNQKKKGAAEDSETLYRRAYYGGRVDLYASEYEGILGGGNKLTTPLRNAYPPESQVEITLTPAGPMVDGTRGEVVTSTFPLGDDGKWTFMIRGVYPGAYTATARLLKAGGDVLPLRLSLEGAKTILKGAGDYDKRVVDWQSSVTVDFKPNDLGPMPRMGVNAVKLYLGE